MTTNGYDKKQIAAFVERIENLEADIRSAKAENAKRCQDIQGDIKSVFDECKDAGIPKKELKAVIKTRNLQRQLEAVRDDLDEESQDTYDQIRFALGDLAETPLGEATLKRAEQGREAVDSLTEH